MPHQHTSNNRREILKLGVAFSAAALTGSPVFAQGDKTETALRFLITSKGRKFGVKITPLANGAGLLTVRELNTNRRYAVAFKFNDNPADNSCKLTFNNKEYQVMEKDGWFATDIPGVTIGSPELRETEPGADGETPDEGLSPEKRAFIVTIFLAIAAVVAGIVYAVGLAIATSEQYMREGVWTVNLGKGRYVMVSRNPRDGSPIVTLEKQDNFMPPPEGTEEQPGVWY